VNCGLIADLLTELPLVLASSSPRRRNILEGLDLEFEIDFPGTEENIGPGETPEDLVIRSRPTRPTPCGCSAPSAGGGTRF